MHPFGPAATVTGALVASLIAVRAIKRKSLSKAGAAAAWVVGFLSICTGLRGFVLLMFYQIGTMATKYHKEIKESRDASAAKGAVRGPSQVLACSAIAVVCSLAHALLYGEEQPIDFVQHPQASSLACAVIAHHATCLADTLASEFGILSRRDPVLVTQPWRGAVPPGTNGGVTWWGTLWSGLGGALMGLGTVLMDVASGIPVRPAVTISYGLTCGLLGSFIDSALGATVQISYYDKEKKLAYCSDDSRPSSATHICGADVLSNVQVNLVSVLATTALGGIVVGPLIFGS